MRVGAHEHDVGGLDRDVGARADRDPDVGLREGGGVVDAVADHGDLLALVLESLDIAGLVLGRDLGEHAVDAELVSDGRGRALVVARDHRDLEP